MPTADTAREVKPRPTRRRQIDVLKEQLAILREIKAPQQLIEIAERLIEEAERKRSARP